MPQDAETRNDLTISSRARRIHDWLMRPQTVRILGPAALLLGVALVAIGLLVVPGDDGPTADRAAPTMVPATAYPVPPVMVEGYRFLVPPLQPFAGFWVIIDSLGVHAPAVQLGLDPRRVPQVPDDAASVAWYDFSAKPGAGDNAVLAGHVSWGGEPGAFAHLDELQVGDIVRVKWKTGLELVYEVSANRTIPVDDPEALQVMEPTGVDTITLITCGGRWVTDPTNPLGGEFKDRIVVQARLVEPSVAALSR